MSDFPPWRFFNSENDGLSPTARQLRRPRLWDLEICRSTPGGVEIKVSSLGSEVTIRSCEGNLPPPT